MQPATAQTAPPTAITPVRKTVVLEISNKAGLVTVREKDGVFLFAQVLAAPSSDLHIEVDPNGKDALGKTRDYRLTLRDAEKKALWAILLGDGKPSSFSFKSSTGENDAGVIISMT
ncbi:MAG: hypothetical protein H7Y38_14640, partial [Armatimonadetes bacterium]|nr:hypothetical protein [Armatimonadota bacterium]